LFSKTGPTGEQVQQISFTTVEKLNFIKEIENENIQAERFARNMDSSDFHLQKCFQSIKSFKTLDETPAMGG
jgi:hypothetical protein